MKAMILAAGRGNRMGVLTDRTPKPLLPLAGMPLIEYHIRALASAGFDQLVINVAWLGEQIVNTIGSGERFGVDIVYSREPEGALETAGGIAQALALLGADPFMVINADVWSDFPLHVLREALSDGAENGDLAHLIMVPNPDHNRRGDFYFEGTGVSESGDNKILTHGRLVSETHAYSVKRNTDDNGDSGLPKFTFSGIGVYRPEAFKIIQGRQPLGPLLTHCIASNQVSASTYHGHWWDVGTPERLADVEQFLKGEV